MQKLVKQKDYCNLSLIIFKIPTKHKGIKKAVLIMGLLNFAVLN